MTLWWVTGQPVQGDFPLLEQNKYLCRKSDGSQEGVAPGLHQFLHSTLNHE